MWLLPHRQSNCVNRCPICFSPLKNHWFKLRAAEEKAALMGAQFNFLLFLVPLARFERATRGLGNRCSIQLSYRGTSDDYINKWGRV